MPSNAYRIAHSMPALNGETVTQAHADYCFTNGHARHAVDGVDTGACPRCGVALNAGIDAIEPDAESTGKWARDYFSTMSAEVIFDGVYGQTYNDARLILLAVSMGWNDASAERVASDSVANGGELDDVDADAMPDMAGEALDYVNEIGEVYGWWLDWVDGDLMVARVYVTLSICECCLSALANDDESGCRDYYNHVDGDDDHPHGVCTFRDYPWRDGWHVTPGIMPEEHAIYCPAYSDPDAWADVQCECSTDDCSLAACDGCGADSGTYARRELVTATKYAPRR